MDITVHHVELSVWGGQQVFVSTVELPRTPGMDIDNITVRVTPIDTFESLAAEYQIDPDSQTGWDQLLELLFYGRMEGDTPEDVFTDPDSLLNAPTIAHARAKKQAKVRARRGAGKLRGATGVSPDKAILNNATALLSSGAEDPLEFIKRNAPMSRPHLRVKEEHTRRLRVAAKARAAGRNTREMTAEDGAHPRRVTPKVGQRESAEALASRLLGPPQVEPHQPPPADFTKGRKPA